MIVSRMSAYVKHTELYVLHMFHESHVSSTSVKLGIFKAPQLVGISFGLGAQ